MCIDVNFDSKSFIYENSLKIYMITHKEIVIVNKSKINI